MTDFERALRCHHLEDADRHIAEGRDRITRLESLRAHERASGNPTEALDGLINECRRSLGLMKNHREMIRRELAAEADTEPGDHGCGDG